MAPRHEHLDHLLLHGLGVRSVAPHAKTIGLTFVEVVSDGGPTLSTPASPGVSLLHRAANCPVTLQSKPIALDQLPNVTRPIEPKHLRETQVLHPRLAIELPQVGGSQS